MLSKTTITLYLVFLFVSPSTQNLNKRPLRNGLGDLDFNFFRLPSHSAGLGGDRNLCHCSGASVQDVLSVTYQTPHTHTLALCMCPNAVTGASDMISTMGRVPYEIRRYNRGMISSTAGKCGGAGSSGDVSFYCERNMHVSVFIHESAHSFDRGKSASNEWRDAVARDSCVPDPYANSNYADNFAQVVVLWTHLVGVWRDGDLGGNEYSCMRNQLALMARYLPAHSLRS